jgi:hypothetical protein
MCWRKKEVEWAYMKIEEKIKRVKLGRLKKHLGTIYDWKQDKSGNTYLEASTPKMMDELSEKFEQARGKKAKEYATHGTPGKTLKKNDYNMVDIDAYKSIFGKNHVLRHQDCTGNLQRQKRTGRTPIQPW